MIGPSHLSHLQSAYCPLIRYMYHERAWILPRRQVQFPFRLTRQSSPQIGVPDSIFLPLKLLIDAKNLSY